MGPEGIGGVKVQIRGDWSTLKADFAQAQSASHKAGQDIAGAFNSGSKSASASLASLQSAIAGAGGAAQSAVPPITDMGGAIGGMSPLALGAAGALTAMVQATLSAASSAVKLASGLEVNSVAFTRMLGSAQAAQKHLGELRQFALGTPFEFSELLAASKRMQALGFSAQQVIPILRSVGDAVAGTGGTSQNVERIILALSQMQAKGRVMAQEMNQLAEQMIPAWQSLAKSIGVSVPEAMKMAEKGAISAAVAIPAILAGMNEKFAGTMEAQNKTLTGMWRETSEALKFALTDAGASVLPILKEMFEAVIPLIKVVGELAKNIDQLGNLPGVQLLRERVGLLIDVFGLFTALLKRLTDDAKTLAAMSSVLNRELASLPAPVRALALPFEALLKVWGGIISTFEDIRSIIRGLSATVVGVDLKPLKEGLDRIQLGVGKTKEASDALSRSMGEMSAAAKKIVDDQAAANKSLSDAKAVYSELLAARKRGAATDADVQRALVAVNAAQKEATQSAKAAAPVVRAVADESGHAAKQIQTLGLETEVLAERMRRMVAERHKDVKALVDLKIALEDGTVGQKAFTEGMAEQLQELKKLVQPKGLPALSKEIEDQLAPALEIANPALDEFGNALQRTATFGDQLRDVLSGIKDNLPGDIAGGLVNLLKGLFGDDTNRRLKEQAEQLKQSLAAAAEELAAFADETNRRILETTKKYDEALDKEIGALRKSLAERKADFEKYSRDIGKKIQEVTATNRRELQEQQSDAQRSFDQREREYRDYVQEAMRQERQLRDAAGRELRAALSDLRDNLAERTTEYERFVRDASTSIDSLTRSFYRDIDSLNRESNRRLEDEQRSFTRDQQNLNEQLRQAEAEGDEQRTREIRRQLAERAQDYLTTTERIREDQALQTKELQERIREEKDALRQQLQDEGEEYARYVEDIRKQQQTVTEENQRQLRQQLDDIRRGLIEQKKELDAARDELVRTLAELTMKFNEDLNRQLSDLRENLAERQLEFENYTMEVERQIQEVTARNREELAQEIADLNAALAEKTSEYEAYKSEVFAQLAEIEAQHKSVLDRIADMWKNVFAIAGEALARFVTEYLTNLLIRKLTDAIGLTDKLGSATAKAFGGGAGALPGGGVPAPSVPGGAQGGAGGMAGGAGGLMGTLGAAGAIAGAISSIIGNFQMAKQETTLNAIEHEVRYSQIHLLTLLEQANTYWPKLAEISEYLWSKQSGWFQSLSMQLELIVDNTLRIGDLLAFGSAQGGALPLPAPAGGGGQTVNLNFYGNINTPEDFQSMLDKINEAIGKGGQT